MQLTSGYTRSMQVVGTISHGKKTCIDGRAAFRCMLRDKDAVTKMKLILC